MKKAFAVCIALLFTGAPAFAGQFGPAQAQTRPGQFALGVGAFAYSDDWALDKVGSTEVGITAEARQAQFFLQANLGLFPTWETYLRAGMADLRIDEMLNGKDFRDSYQPYGTLGLKGLIWKGKYFDWGAFAEGSYFFDYEDSANGATLEIDEGFSANAGLTIQKMLEGALLYGGPFFHYREADVTITNFIYKGVPISGLGTFEEDSNIGGFLGIRWYALGDIVVEGEIQVRDRVSAGASISFLF